MRLVVGLTMVAVVMFVPGSALAQIPTPIPVQGEESADMQEFDTAMLSVMSDNDLLAGALAISHDGEVIYRKSFGWADEDETIGLTSNAMMRLASVTKPITAAAVRQLVDEIQKDHDPSISLSSKVFTVGSSPGILDIAPFHPPPQPGDTETPTQDPRLANVTIAQLIQHRGGWDRDTNHDPGTASWWFQNGDLTYKERTLSGWLSLDGPPSREQVAAFVLGQPLKFTPGFQQQYSNEGYFFLGLVLEQLIETYGLPYGDGGGEGAAFLDYVRSEIFADLCVPGTEVNLGLTLPDNPREPFYDDPCTWGPPTCVDGQRHGLSVLDPLNVTYDPRPYGGNFFFENRVSQGRGVATAHSILKLADAFIVRALANDIGVPISGGHFTGCHSGALSGGTRTLACQRSDGIDFVVLLDQNCGSCMDSIHGQLNYLIANRRSWPTTPAVDANQNGTDDLCDIVLGQLTDADGNGYPDEHEQCESDSECSDELPCTADTCEYGACVFTSLCARDEICHPATEQCEVPCDGPDDPRCDDDIDCTLDQCFFEVQPAGEDPIPGACRWANHCQ